MEAESTKEKNKKTKTKLGLAKQKARLEAAREDKSNSILISKAIDTYIATKQVG